MSTLKMNREIKFRFWNAKICKYEDSNYFCIFDGKPQLRHVKTNELLDVSDIVTAEQFTGLTDKNGVDIYEGDIVSGSGTGILIIVFDDGGFMYKNKENHYFHMFSGHTVAEIIGNIHEHKHLLED